MQTLQIHTDDSTKSIKPKKGETFDLEELQDGVNGLITLLPLAKHKAYMVVNSESKELSLPVNYRATEIYRDAYPESADIVLGNVLIVQESEIK